jgi:hypothetical protein
MNKEAYDESNIDPVDRCVTRRGMQPGNPVPFDPMQQSFRFVGDAIDCVIASPYLSAVFGAAEATSFWKRGSRPGLRRQVKRVGEERES